ncbi:MAG: glycosyltransferase family 4 protein [Hyphomonadaceae bacterium]|nr:glycosyltransferase family 4 protein [Hyphomonadaceae bacterium]
MKIAQIAPLAESCPPALYGGTERVVSYLTEELVDQGHDVTLFASGDSITAAQLVPCADRALRLQSGPVDALPYHMIMLEEVARRAHEFDVLHFHIDLMHAPVVRAFADKTLTTLHGRLDLPGLAPFYKAFPRLPLISISDSQRLPLPPVNWVKTIYHGLPRDLLSFSAEPRDGYLAFLGRISPEKRPDRAIEIAVRSGMPLKIAAKIDRVDQLYWEEKIAPLVKANAQVEYIGEITDRQKAEFLGGASALLFPIDWEEPFGLVMIEAMACGTPVIAFRRGSVPEVMDHGVTGFVVDTVDDAVRAVDQLAQISRAKVRAVFDERFTVQRMARDYINTFSKCAGAGAAMPPPQLTTDLQSITL